MGEFAPAADQLNVIAAAWIQAMVHDWIDHFESKDEQIFDRGEEFGCPMKKFKVFKTEERGPDGDFNSRRTQWWDASFVYGNNSAQLKEARTFVGGKLKTNPDRPDTLPQRGDSTNVVGDQKNSWVGVALLQEIFLKEHNYVADEIAKSHTIDWTVELLKTRMMRIAMETNWYGVFYAI